MFNPNDLVPSQVANFTWLMLAIAAAVLLVVAILLLVSVFRKRRDEVSADQLPTGDSKSLRWVIISGIAVPAVLLIILLAFSISIENASAAIASSANELTIQVIGHQWWWEVNYLGDGFETANEIHIPVGKPVTFMLTSADVVHGFWIPQLHPQMDMIPGQTTTLTLRADQPGTYLGQCTEYCGIQHAHMEFVVIAQSQADYDAWIAQQKTPASEPPAGSLEKYGQQAFLGSSCVYCHTIQGTNASGRIGPDLTHFASRATLGAGAAPNTPANLSGWMTNSQAIKPGNKMPPMDLDADQIQAILAYLETLK